MQAEQQCVTTRYYRTDMSLMLSRDFATEIIQRQHYNPQDQEVVLSVLHDIRNCIKDQEGMELRITPAYADVVITLGSRLDVLLDRYGRQYHVLRQLVTEHVVSAVLMHQYERVMELLEQETGRRPGRVHFWGSEPEYPLERIPEILEQLKHTGVHYREPGILTPTKSVICRVDLDGTGFHGICVDCERKKRGECQFWGERACQTL